MSNMMTTALPIPPNESKGAEILGVVTAFTALALVTFCARAFVRIRMMHIFGADDWIILAAMVLSLTATGLVIGQVIYGVGRHIAYLDPEIIRIGLKLNFIGQILWLWAIPLVRVSAGVFLLRIAPTRAYRLLLQGIMLFLMTYTLACFLTLVLQCKNISVLWDARVKTTCYRPGIRLSLAYAYSVINVLADVFFSLIPIPILRRLRINPRTKILLIFVMGLGSFAGVAAIIKIVYLSNYGKSLDFTWDSTYLTIWTGIELNVGIVAANLPCLKPLFKRILDNSGRYHPGGRRLGKSTRLRATSKVKRSGKAVQLSSRLWQPSLSQRNESREIILADTRMPPLSITKTTEVIIDRSNVDPRTQRNRWDEHGETHLAREVEDCV